MEAAAMPRRGDLSALRIDRDARPSRPRRGLLWFFLVVCFLSAAGGAAYHFREKLFDLGPVVETALVVRTGGTGGSELLLANGYVAARHQAGVTPKVSGRIKVLHKDLGDRVLKGEVIAELDNFDILAMLEEARATMWVADLTAEREKKLLEANVGTQADADLSLARAKETRARVKNLEEQVENTKVRAPFDGIIIIKNGEVGETVSLFGGQTARKSGPIVVIADFREFEVEADINEIHVGKVRPGQPCDVELLSVPTRRYKGRLRQIVPAADRQKATVQAKVTILDPDERVFPELSAKVTFLPEGAPVIEPIRIIAPKDGVVERGGRRVAFVVEGERVRMKHVEAVEGKPGQLIISGGLDGGESIVLRPSPELADGARVRLAKASP